MSHNTFEILIVANSSCLKVRQTVYQPFKFVVFLPYLPLEFLEIDEEQSLLGKFCHQAEPIFFHVNSLMIHTFRRTLAEATSTDILLPSST